MIADLWIDAGGFPGLSGETPLAHLPCDRDDDFLDIVERRLASVLAHA